MTRLWCWLVGHDDAASHLPGLLRVSCDRCGRDSSGVEIGPPRFVRTQPGASRRVRKALLRRLQLAAVNHARHDEVAA